MGVSTSVACRMPRRARAAGRWRTCPPRRFRAVLNSSRLPIESILAVLQRQEEFAMRFAIGIVALAALVAGCTASSSNSPEQSTNPAAGGPGLTYPAHNMAEFDAAMIAADDHCYKEEDLKRAQYVPFLR